MAEKPFGQNVLIKVGTFTPHNDIGQGVIAGIGDWVAGIYGGANLKLGSVVKFRITSQGQPPKDGDDIYVKLDDVFAVVSEPEVVPGEEGDAAP
mgnify:CR=1 FL=1